MCTPIDYCQRTCWSRLNRRVPNPESALSSLIAVAPARDTASTDLTGLPRRQRHCLVVADPAVAVDTAASIEFRQSRDAGPLRRFGASCDPPLTSAFTNRQNSHDPFCEPATLLLSGARQSSRRALTMRPAWPLSDTSSHARRTMRSHPRARLRKPDPHAPRSRAERRMPRQRRVSADRGWRQRRGRPRGCRGLVEPSSRLLRARGLSK